MKKVNEAKKSKASHTATPWRHAEPLGEGLDAVLSDHVNKSGTFYVAQCNNKEDAAFIVRAVNSHEALLEAAKLAKRCLKENRGPSLDEFKIIQNAIAQAEGK